MVRHLRLLALGSVLVFAVAAPGQQESALQEQARAALSQTTGTLVVPGLSAPVDVIRDGWGVPHIYADNEHDLFFAQGFVAAQDRLWQLDLWRRIAEGKLSEILGPAGVKRDTFARLLRYRGNWDEEWRAYGPGTREIVQAFVAGINAQIDIAGRRPETLPIEFQLTGSRPGHWTPETVVGRMAGYVMTRNARTEVQRALLVARVGAERASALMPTDPSIALSVPAGLDLADIDETILDITTGTSESVDFSPLRTQSQAVALPLMPDLGEVGSNNWVVSGKLTATGKPMLANDPHRALMLPSLRYTVHLNAPGWNVIGAGEPALPGVAAGHNDRVAFGFTIVGIDQQDLYVERLDPGDPTRYRYRQTWETLRIERETLHVKGEPDREIELRFTRHGPVLQLDSTRHRAYALRWVGSEPGTAGYLRSLMLDRARSVDDVRAAIAGWKVPSENIVYADTDGQTGWVAAGLAPVRRNWSGLLPVPGDTGEYEWDGFLKPELLPQLANPASGFIATANHNILPPGYPHRLGYEFGAPWRFKRIVEMLGTAGPHSSPDGRTVPALQADRRPAFTVGAFERMQHDELSLQASAITWALSKALVEPHGRLDEAAGQAAQFLTHWDGLLSKESGPAALYEVWLPLLGTAFGRAFPSDVGPSSSTRMSGDRIVEQLRSAGWVPEPRQTPWVDGTRAKPTKGEGAARTEGRDRVIQALTGPALGEAWREMVKRQGPDPAKWSWGAAHYASFEHALAFTAERKQLFNLPPVPRGGDGTTVNATSGGVRQTAGASYRQIIDLSNWENSVTVNVPGESGQPESPHYGDLLPLWANGRYHPMVFSRASVDRAAAARLRLQPR